MSERTWTLWPPLDWWFGVCNDDRWAGGRRHDVWERGEGGAGLSRGRNETKRAYIQNRKRREVEHFEIILFCEFMEWAKASIRHSEGTGEDRGCHSCNSNQFPSNSRIFAFVHRLCPMDSHDIRYAMAICSNDAFPAPSHARRIRRSLPTIHSHILSDSVCVLPSSKSAPHGTLPDLICHRSLHSGGVPSPYQCTSSSRQSCELIPPHHRLSLLSSFPTIPRIARRSLLMSMTLADDYSVRALPPALARSNSLMHWSGYGSGAIRLPTSPPAIRAFEHTAGEEV